MSPAEHFLERRTSDACEKLCFASPSAQYTVHTAAVMECICPAAAQIKHEINGAVGASGVKLNVNTRKRKCSLPPLLSHLQLSARALVVEPHVPFICDE